MCGQGLGACISLRQESCKKASSQEDGAGRPGIKVLPVPGLLAGECGELNDFAELGERWPLLRRIQCWVIELSFHTETILYRAIAAKGRALTRRRRGSALATGEFFQANFENSKRKFERDCREAEKAVLMAERLDQDINATKADVEKAKQQANLRSHMAEESKNEYASCLQKFNHNQSQFYFLEMPQIFSKLQEMDECRVQRLKEGYSVFSDTEQQVLPIIGKCLEGMKAAADLVDEKNDSQMLVDLHKSGFERPGDMEFEDFSQPMNRTSSDSSLGNPRGTLDSRLDPRLLSKNKTKRWPFGRKNKRVFCNFCLSYFLMQGLWAEASFVSHPS
uniref:Uncharacterized protein n=1 Tax=Sphaerodactylus townsendi TaxID=933632 RepID=A0ACB8EN75_9SAUR